jgi:PAS domain S-box-containing protein
LSEPSEEAPAGPEWLRVTLASIGDAVITTDLEGRVTFLNHAAEVLTGWTSAAAAGRPLTEVFRIINEETRLPAECPATRALREGVVVGLANHTLLVARDGVEHPIDDSAAPIRGDDGAVLGVVLVFREVARRRETENALRLSEERFRLLVESTRDYAIFMLDPQGRVATWNPGAQRIKGYAAHEIVGRHFSVFYPRDVVDAGWPAKELEVATAEGRFEDEGWRLRKDGSRFWANVVITALRDASGRLVGFSKITRDLTERRQALLAVQSREERFRAMAQSATDAIITADADGTITFWNKAATTIFGLDAEDALGRPLTDLMPERYRPQHEAGLARLRAGGESRILGTTVALHGRRRDGTEFPIELSLSTWMTESGRTYCGILRDVTERLQLERTRLQAEAIADLSRRKDEFLAMLSHELRNPLAPILNALHMLQLKENEDPIQRQARAIIERQVGHLTRIVDDLLEVSRITTGSFRLRRESGDLRGVVERAADASRPSVVQRRHELSTTLPSEPIWVYGDPTRLEQVVVNLVVNAAKYTDEGGRISISLAREGDEAVLRVRDTGVGIAPELLPRIFDLFTQAERSLDRSQGGLGVGLTVVRRIVEMHGGRVEARSDGVGRGSEFVVRLPTAEAPAGAAATARSPKAQASPDDRRRVLVVDDNRDAADTTAILLRRAGHEVRVAYDGPAGLGAALAWRPDVVVLDLGLPEMDGYEVARRIRSEGVNGMRLVAVSGYGQEIDRRRSREAGFDAHLVKPVEPSRLADAVKRSD